MVAVLILYSATVSDAVYVFCPRTLAMIFILALQLFFAYGIELFECKHALVYNVIICKTESTTLEFGRNFRPVLWF